MFCRIRPGASDCPVFTTTKVGVGVIAQRVVHEATADDAGLRQLAGVLGGAEREAVGVAHGLDGAVRVAGTDVCVAAGLTLATTRGIGKAPEGL